MVKNFWWIYIQVIHIKTVLVLKINKWTFIYRATICKAPSWGLKWNAFPFPSRWTQTKSHDPSTPTLAGVRCQLNSRTKFYSLTYLWLPKNIMVTMHSHHKILDNYLYSVYSGNAYIPDTTICKLCTLIVHNITLFRFQHWMVWDCVRWWSSHHLKVHM